MIKKLGDGIKIVKNEKWDFNNNVASQFNKHANKSIPGYEMGHDLIISIAKDILPPQARILDIGCSTGYLLDKISKISDSKSTLYGIDISSEMIKFAKKNSAKKIKFYCKDIHKFKEDNFDLIISYYVMQFIPLKLKIHFLKKVFSKLNIGGKFIIFEKVSNNSGGLKNIFEHSYRDFKLKNGYSALTIFNKDESLRGAMFCATREQNLSFFENAKFTNIEVIQQNFMFEGYMMTNI